MFAIVDRQTGILLHKKGQIVLFETDQEAENYLTLFANFSMQAAAAQMTENPFLPMEVQTKFNSNPWEKLDEKDYTFENTIKYTDLNI